MIGQPFDIVKVRLQTQKVGENAYSGAVDCLKKIMRHEGGALALWRGSVPPLIGIGAATSIQFGVNENTKSFMRNITKSRDLSFYHLAICGSIAGIVNSFISTPAEHIRIRMQSQGAMANPPYKSSIDCIRKIYGQYGLKGLYKGGVPTLYRETLAYAVYFSMYDWCIKKISTPEKKPETYKIAMSGAFAGACFWFSVYPIDAIKTKIQTDAFKNPQYKSTLDCVRKTYRTQGFNGFWRGLGPCLVRSLPVNSGTFIVYEGSLGLMNGKPKENEFSYL
jgi:solute carrier family 25 carnitine/acylcarnitine transporter 20/29